MARNPAPFTADEMAGMTFPKDPDWGYLFMRAMATVKQETDENERLRTRLTAVGEIAMAAVNEHETPVMRLAMIARLAGAEGERRR